jgi:hypothetical protein
MGIPSRARLVGELHCLTEDGEVVITAQRWSDPEAPAERPCGWLRLVRNGRHWQTVQYCGARRSAELRERWSSLAERYRPTALGVNEMWSKLRQLTGIEQGNCLHSGCSGTIPVGGGRCLVCGRNERSVAAGELSGARRRGVLVLNLRKPR